MAKNKKVKGGELPRDRLPKLDQEQVSADIAKAVEKLDERDQAIVLATVTALAPLFGGIRFGLIHLDDQIKQLKAEIAK
jgi:hypothetical protein